ncbi:GTP pyrophosphokinase [Paenibacillus sp. MZ04-78.2]|uniref:GTP pyrophosphokinase n=1 Tax=Paenibacillus sp. MZ04-78.2 TaxID=2962034 RepID=UPI0020B8B31D|nr:GTP pyrophosphokinase [Paenibacillus sp. MZ04-78.2]MCP3772306.1 GTP pyrophosphokinase [Paenibacillus sp. MZ04-78.2]
MPDLTKAILIATAAHQAQLDKGNQPYILHPLRLMLQAPDNDSRIVAVLHDVIEDSDMTMEALRQEGFAEHLLEALDCLTRRENESYNRFLQRIKPNALARFVKLLDLEDNRDVRRIKNLSEKDFARLQKYEKAVDYLLSRSS